MPTVIQHNNLDLDENINMCSSLNLNVVCKNNFWLEPHKKNEIESNNNNKKMQQKTWSSQSHLKYEKHKWRKKKLFSRQRWMQCRICVRLHRLRQLKLLRIYKCMHMYVNVCVLLLIAKFVVFFMFMFMLTLTAQKKKRYFIYFFVVASTVIALVTRSYSQQRVKIMANQCTLKPASLILCIRKRKHKQNTHTSNTTHIIVYTNVFCANVIAIKSNDNETY